MSELETVLARLKEIETAVQDGHVQDWEKASADFEERLRAYVDVQVRTKIEQTPVYRAAGSNQEQPVVPQGNRYASMAKSFASDGYSRYGNQRLLPIDLWMASELLEKTNRLIPEKSRGPSDDLVTVVKALTSTGAGTGDEYVPTNMADMLWSDFFLATRVAGAISFIPMPSDPFDVPLGLGPVTWKKGTQNTATSVSDPATSKSVLTSTEQVTYQRWSYTLDEDAVVAMMPTLREELARSGGEQIDAFLLNADSTNAATGNINLVDADPADDEYYLSDGQDGLRHLWIVDNTAQQVNAGGAALTDAHLVSALGALDKYAANPQRCAFVMDVQTYLKGMLSSAAAAPGNNVITIDKIGSDAIVRTGVLAMYRGVEIIPSSQYLLSAATGSRSTTPANNVLGSITLFNRDMWRSGFRRNVLIEADRDITTRSMLLVTSFRVAIAARGNRATAKHTAGVRNILL